MKPAHFKMARQLFLALLLVVAQGQLLIHQVDLDAHSGEASCEACIHIGHLGSAVVNEVTTVDWSLALATYSSSLYRASDFTLAYARPQPRAPPVSSLL